MPLVCDDNRQNLGNSNCKRILQVPSSFMLLPTSFSIDATDTDANNITALQAALLADVSQRAYLIAQEDVFSVEPVPEDDIREDSAIGKQISVRDGQYRFNVMLGVNFEYHKALHSHAGRGGKILIFDQNDVVLGVSILQTGTDMTGMTINLFDPGNVAFSDGSAGTKPAFYFSLDSPKEINTLGWTEDWSGIIPSLIPLTTVQIAVTSSIATLIVVSITGKLDNRNILGLVQADFTLIDAALADQSGAISSVVDNGDGTYNIIGAGFVTGFVGMVDADAVSVVGYESEADVAITV